MSDRANESPASGRSLARDLRDLTIVEFANGLAFSAFVPFLALWLTGPVGMSPLAAGVSGFGVYSLTAIAGGLAGGRMSDRIGRRPTMILGLAAGTARLGLLAVTTDPIAVTALIAVGGLVDSLVPPATGALVADRVPASRLNEGFGTVRAARTLALGLGPVLGAALAPLSFTAVLAAAAGCRGIACAAAVFVREPPRRTATTERVPGSVLRDGPFMSVLAGTVVLAVFYGWYDTVVPLHLEAQGIGVETWGAIYAVGALFTAFVAVRVARLIDRMPNFRGWVAVGATSYALGFALILPGRLETVVPGVAFVTLAQMILNPVESSLTALLAPASRTGAYQGALSVVYATAFATGPVFGLALYDASASAAFLAAVLVLPVGGFLLSAAIKRAAAVGRLRLTPGRPQATVAAMSTDPYSLADQKAVHEGRVRYSQKRLEELRQLMTEARALQHRRSAWSDLGTLLVVIATLMTAAAIERWISADGDVTGEFFAVLTAATVLALAGAAYQWRTATSRSHIADDQIQRLERAEREELERLGDAWQGVVDALDRRSD